MSDTSHGQTDAQDMAPWAHPKAQAWFKSLFNRSQFAFMLEDVVKQPTEEFNRDQIRAILTFAVLLGRKEIWPDEHQMVLKLVLEKSRAVAKDSSNSAGPMTIRQHRSRKDHQTCEFHDEIEIMRRRLGVSFKTTELKAPGTWRQFWT